MKGFLTNRPMLGFFLVAVILVDHLAEVRFLGARDSGSGVLNLIRSRESGHARRPCRLARQCRRPRATVR